ncbi:MAG TPA: hypothetical protein VIL89_07885 [Clostridia bacterium]
MNKSAKNSAVIAAGGFILLILFILQGIPMLNGIVISFKEYNVMKGIAGSPFTGFANISGLFANINFRRVLINTVRLNMLYLVIVLVLGGLLSVSLMTVHKRIRDIFLTIILIPLFIPGSILAHICISSFRGTNALLSPQLFPLIYAFLLAVKNAGIPTVFILKTWGARGREEKTGFEKLMAPAAFILIQLASILSTDADVLSNLINPMVYETSDTLDYFTYRTGFMQMQVGTTQAAWLIQFIVHVVLGFLVYNLLRIITQRKPLLQGSKNGAGQIPDTERINEVHDTNPVGCIIPVLFSLFLAWFVFKPLLIDGVSSLFKGMFPVNPVFAVSYIRYVILYGLIALIGVPITYVLAKSAACPGAFGSFTRIVLVFFLLAGGIGMHQFLFYRSLGVSNTVFSLILYYLIPVANSLVLAVIIAFKRENDSEAGGGLSFWKSAFILSLIQFTVMWNSEQAPLIFIARQEIMPPVLIARAISQGIGGPVDTGAVIGVDFLVSLLPVALFLIFRKFFTEWILLSFTKSK